MSRERTKKVITELIEKEGKGEKVVMSKAMEACGFSPSYSHNPQNFTRTKAYKEESRKYLDPEEIKKRHDELIGAAQISHYHFPDVKETIRVKGKKAKIKRSRLTNDEMREIIESVPGCKLIYVKKDSYGSYAYFSQPDNRSRQSAIDMAYKLSGDYAPERIQVLKRKYGHLTNAELMERQRKIKAFLLKE